MAEPPARQAFFDRIDKRHLTPLGTVPLDLVTADATVSIYAEGRGRALVGQDVRFNRAPRDRIAVPRWAREDAVPSSYSNPPVQEALHLFREDRGNA